MIIMVGSSECPRCAALKEKLEELELGCVYLDGASLRSGEYGVPSSPDDPRLDAIVALVEQNLEVPVLLVDGVRRDVDAWLTGADGCADGVCRVAS